MIYNTFSAMEWIYPDTVLRENEVPRILHIPGNSDECFQVLTDISVKEGCRVDVQCDCVVGTVECSQLLPAHVSENCAKDIFTTLHYEEVKEFVTRRAPFDVYDMTRPLSSGTLEKGRVAFFVRVNVPRGVSAGAYPSCLRISMEGEDPLEVAFTVRVYETTLPDAKDAHLEMVNWISYGNVAKHHQVEIWSPEYCRILRMYLENLVDMRNTYLMLPRADAVRDADGNVIDFDFSKAEWVGNLALELGMKKLTGNFAVKWKVWSDTEIYLKWDTDRDTTSEKALKELELYYKRAYESVIRNHWEDCYFQSVMDEVEVPNYEPYKVVNRIAREQMPGIPVYETIEDLRAESCIDVLVAKQVGYEDQLEEYRALQEHGKEVWVYTCAFPGGPAMKRILDFPLVTTRLPIWLCYRYGLRGFLCWGYNFHTEQFEKQTNMQDGEFKTMAGDGFIVYPGKDGTPWYSVRGHIQRMAMYDYELLYQLGKRDPETARACVERMCRGFSDYERSSEVFDRTREEILGKLG